MSAVLAEPAATAMPGDEHFARNLIGGRWQFPAAPYEYEIRSPADSTITSVVPLSSRFDVARAAAAADAARLGHWADPAGRGRLLDGVLDRLESSRSDLARLQAVETGLSFPDSLAAVDATLRSARALLRRGVPPGPARPAGVTGHILSWGAPFTEAVTSALPALLRGNAVIIKPSLRGPLSPVAFAHVATQAGLPAGVINVVQGTGVDVGAELISRRGLSALYVRASSRTVALAERGHVRTNVPLHLLRGGGNAVVVGPHAADLGALALAVTSGVRMNSAGGPFGLSLLAVHADRADTVLATLLAALAGTVAAPLPAEPVRRQAARRVDALVSAGAKTLLGGSTVPDDVAHRMGWRLPPTVLHLGAASSPAVAAEQASEPLGPVLGVFTWRHRVELAGALRSPRAADGVVTLWGADQALAMSLPYGLVVDGASHVPSSGAATLPAAWLGGRATASWPVTMPQKGDEYGPCLRDR
jgi:acyl-CoA reductase-like NAD-dependent aldehyde dehydrogenase